MSAVGTGKESYSRTLLGTMDNIKPILVVIGLIIVEIRVLKQTISLAIVLV